MGIISDMIKKGQLTLSDIQEYNIESKLTSFHGEFDKNCLTYYSSLDLVNGQAVVPNGITKIEGGAFDTCATLLNTVELPNTIEEIGVCAFAYCGHLTTINMPNSLKLIGEGAFLNTDLRSIEIPAGVKEIEPHTFAYDTKLTNVVIHEGLTNIGKQAFAFTQLKNIKIPSTIQEIGDEAFKNVPLSQVVLPEGVKLGVNAFDKKVKISYAKVNEDKNNLKF